MKVLKASVILITAALFTLIMTPSCSPSEEVDLCEGISCQNGGLCEDGTCDCPDGYTGTNCENVDCPDGYTGTNCENFDPSQVQALLDMGKTPKELFDGNIPLESLYGKMYEGGLIFYLNTTDGTGMIAAPEDQSDGEEWGCSTTNIPNLNNIAGCPGMGDCMQPVPDETEVGARIGDGATNTDAILAGCTQFAISARLCRNVGAGWFLPSRGELNLIYTNLKEKEQGGLDGNFYWSSSEASNGDAWSQYFVPGNQFSGGQYSDDKLLNAYVRAARAF